jgi:hypothetical protein
MADIDRHHGKEGQVKLDVSGGATPLAVVSLDNWDLDMATQKVKVTAFEDPNEVYVIGRPDIKGTYKGWYDNSPEGLVIFDAIQSTVAPAFELLPVKTDTLHKFSGRGWMDGKITVDSNGGIAVSGTFVAAGAWTLPASAITLMAA